jgi:hypothetical protein
MELPFDPNIFELLNGQTRVSGIGPAGGFAYTLDLSVPSITCAIHAGHRVRETLLPRMMLSEKDRLAEEDAATDQIIGKCPSILWGQDSRAEYDLNRPKASAMPVTPEMFWGMQVYRTPPTEAMQVRSRMKYEAFYRFVGTVIRILLDRFGACVVYDIHSYNRHRQIENGHPAPPVFNLGTRCIDRHRWRAPVQEWLEALRGIPIPGMRTTVAENDVFSGQGAFCRTLTRWDPRILVLPTEILKIYMDEKQGRLDLPILQKLKAGLARAVFTHGDFFQKSFCGALPL